MKKKNKNKLILIFNKLQHIFIITIIQAQIVIHLLQIVTI